MTASAAIAVEEKITVREPALAARLEELMQNVLRSYTASCRSILTFGRHLTVLKEECAHGQWLPLLAEMRIPASTATYAMKMWHTSTTIPEHVSAAVLEAGFSLDKKPVLDVVVTVLGEKNDATPSQVITRLKEWKDERPHSKTAAPALSKDVPQAEFLENAKDLKVGDSVFAVGKYLNHNGAFFPAIWKITKKNRLWISAEIELGLHTGEEQFNDKGAIFNGNEMAFGRFKNGLLEYVVLRVATPRDRRLVQTFMECFEESKSVVKASKSSLFWFKED